MKNNAPREELAMPDEDQKGIVREVQVAIDREFKDSVYRLLNKPAGNLTVGGAAHLGNRLNKILKEVNNLQRDLDDRTIF